MNNEKQRDFVFEIVNKKTGQKRYPFRSSTHYYRTLNGACQVLGRIIRWYGHADDWEIRMIKTSVEIVFNKTQLGLK